MAAKKRPQSAAEKAAQAALTRAQQVSVAQTGSRVQGVSKGATKTRRLRASGTEMMQYDLARFKNDPFPDLNGGGGGGGGPAQRAGRPTAAPKPKAKPKAKPKVTPEGKKRIKQQKKAISQNERRDNVRAPINTELREERERIAREKAAREAAARKKKREAEAAKRKKAAGKTVKKTGGTIIS